MNAIIASCAPGADIPLLLLVAEDNKIDRMILRKAFEAAGVKVELRFFSDGQELLDYLYNPNAFAGHTLNSSPLLVLLDLNMPRLCGERTLETLRSDDNMGSLPVIIFTTSNSSEQILKCYALGANAFITKSADFVRLTEDMHSLVNFWWRVSRVPLPPRTPATGPTT